MALREAVFGEVTVGWVPRVLLSAECWVGRADKAGCPDPGSRALITCAHRRQEQGLTKAHGMSNGTGHEAPPSFSPHFHLHGTCYVLRQGMHPSSC
jgi:hypothetical protein